MTSSPDSRPHPDVTEISDLTEDLLAPERAVEVRLHLAECPLCADVLVSLTEISSLLGELTADEQMPADVADRIDAALAAEAATDDNGRPDVPQRDVPRGTSPSGASRVPRGTSAAPAGRPTTDTGPGRSDRSDRRRRRRAFTLAAGWAVGVLALGGIVYGVVSAGQNSSSSDASASSAAGAKRSDSTRATGSIADQVRQLLADPYSPNRAGGGSTTAPNDGVSPMFNGTGQGTGSTPSNGEDQSQGHVVADAPSCVFKATHRTQAPLAVGKDRYQGTDSYLVVLPHPADSGLVDAFVVDASCSADAPGTVLFQGTYPRR